MPDLYDAVVVGAGHAGLGVSYFLKEAGCSHIVFERGDIAETWRSQRWDSFAVNTPNFINGLPGQEYDGDEPDGFWLRDELVANLQHYADHFELPIQTRTSVVKVEPQNGHFRVLAEDQNGQTQELTARNVVVASGIMQTPMIPALGTRVPDDILQLHTATYRNPEALPEGGVVIVGSGQSGCQIAEDIAGTGRNMYLCTSKVGRLARRYRGRDMLDWWVDMGFWDVTPDELEDPSILKMKQPQISGVGRFGRSVSLQHLASQGVKIVGRLVDVEGGVLQFDDSARENVIFGDTMSARFKQMIDDYVQREGIDAPAPEPDPADEPDPEARCVTDVDQLDLREAGVTTIIWATGFTASFDWLKVPALDDAGVPIHKRGISSVDGVYFAGFPWLSKRKSGVIYGINEDARRVVDHILARDRG